MALRNEIEAGSRKIRSVNRMYDIDCELFAKKARSSGTVSKLILAPMSELWTWVNLCVNSSVAMRYCTARGWLSELARGHGCDPITEILCVFLTLRRSDR
mmetsp:Transcript_12786/g.23197  ORF Transcript_12786/g.23197 Transcript_12786/m.23197 type:complete len:100 (+) Transcript_12786:910-1209(+)